VIVIFLVGFIAGQIFPRFKDNRIVRHNNDAATLGLQHLSLRDDDNVRTKMILSHRPRDVLVGRCLLFFTVKGVTNAKLVPLEAKVQLLPNAQILERGHACNLFSTSVPTTPRDVPKEKYISDTHQWGGLPLPVQVTLVSRIRSLFDSPTQLKPNIAW
jgi:hypothetical protein